MLSSLWSSLRKCENVVCLSRVYSFNFPRLYLLYFFNFVHLICFLPFMCILRCKTPQSMLCVKHFLSNFFNFLLISASTPSYQVQPRFIISTGSWKVAQVSCQFYSDMEILESGHGLGKMWKIVECPHRLSASEWFFEFLPVMCLPVAKTDSNVW